MADKKVLPKGGILVPRLSRLLTVKQMVDTYPHLFTEGSLRSMIFNRKRNGFDECIVRIGRKILIDTDQLRLWMVHRRGKDPGIPPEPVRTRMPGKSGR